MATEGREGASSLLVLGGREGGGLRQAVAVAEQQGVDHLVGIAAGTQLATWLAAIEDMGLGTESVRILETTDSSEPDSSPQNRLNIAVRNVGGASLGDIGIAVVDSISASGPTTPGVVVNAVGALSDDPGKRFKFLSLIGQRVAVDDGAFLALEGPEELLDHERNTLSTVFDEIRNAD